MDAIFKRVCNDCWSEYKNQYESLKPISEGVSGTLSSEAFKEGGVKPETVPVDIGPVTESPESVEEDDSSDEKVDDGSPDSTSHDDDGSKEIVEEIPDEKLFVPPPTNPREYDIWIKSQFNSIRTCTSVTDVREFQRILGWRMQPFAVSCNEKYEVFYDSLGMSPYIMIVKKANPYDQERKKILSTKDEDFFYGQISTPKAYLEDGYFILSYKTLALGDYTPSRPINYKTFFMILISISSYIERLHNFGFVHSGLSKGIVIVNIRGTWRPVVRNHLFIHRLADRPIDIPDTILDQGFKYDIYCLGQWFKKINNSPYILRKIDALNSMIDDMVSPDLSKRPDISQVVRSIESIRKSL